MEYNDIENLKEEDIKEFYCQIGTNVANIRKSKNISQLELSQMLGHKSSSQVAGSEICYKNYHFNLEQLYKICYVLKVDLCDLLGCPKNSIA